MIFEYIKDMTTASLSSLNRNFEKIATTLNGSIATNNLAPNAVTNSKIADGTITYDKIGTAQIVTALINDLSANSGTIHDLVVTELTVEDQTVQKLTVSDEYAKRITIDWAQIKNVEISDADIEDASISFAKIKDVQITNSLIAPNAQIDQAKINLANILSLISDQGVIDTAQIKDGSITNAKIVELDAGKIKAGTLDASLINVINMNAQSLTVGELKVVGLNLITNSKFDIDSTGAFTSWNTTSVGGTFTRDTTNKLDDNFSMYANFTGVTTTPFNHIDQTFVVEANTDYNCSIYTKSPDITAFLTALMQIDFYASDGSKISTVTNSIIPSQNNTWERKNTKVTTPVNCSSIKFSIIISQNGQLYMAKPMCAKGSLLTPYVPQIAEGIGLGTLDGDTLIRQTITTDKLVAKAITSDKIAANSILVDHIASGTIEAAVAKIATAFISSANIVSLDGTKITAQSITFDKCKGGTLTLGGANNQYGALKMLNASGKEVGSWDTNNSSFSNLSVGTLDATNVVLIGQAISYNLYVDGTNGSDLNNGLTNSAPFKTFKKALDSLPEYINGAINIYVSFYTATEFIKIQGLLGIGSLTVYMDYTCDMKGTIQLINNQTKIFLRGQVISTGPKVTWITGATNAIITNNNCPYVYIENFFLYGQASTSHGIITLYGGYTEVYNCNINGCAYYGGALASAYGGRTYSNGNKGSSNYYGLYAMSGSTVFANGTAPVGTNTNTATSNGGQLIGTSTPTQGTGTGNSNANTTGIKTYTAVSVGNWSKYFGWMPGLAQGASSDTATDFNQKGVIGFDVVQLRGDLSGKTIDSCRLTLTRNSSGGILSAQPVKLYYTDNPSGAGSEPQAWGTGTIIGYIAPGKTVTFDIPVIYGQKLQSGGANGLMLYTTTELYKYYMDFEGLYYGDVTPVLEITYH